MFLRMASFQMRLIPDGGLFETNVEEDEVVDSLFQLFVHDKKVKTEAKNPITMIITKQILSILTKRMEPFVWRTGGKDFKKTSHHAMPVIRSIFRRSLSATAIHSGITAEASPRSIVRQAHSLAPSVR
ncbi:hypothetical protein IV203_025794 [Nitzschia inconspicua]|uniref:Uncharacterized protein n=1 Tax=Nitzschia inconspicua TaxID=303405 RepID=A0A9K3PWD5_9STRA|nr:hypothetical protein IV203_025794 [Nitzschia inconspicua]